MNVFWRWKDDIGIGICNVTWLQRTAFNPYIGKNRGEGVIKGEEDKRTGPRNKYRLKKWSNDRKKTKIGKRCRRVKKEKRYVAKCGIHMHGISSVCAEHIPMMIIIIMPTMWTLISSFFSSFFFY